jgi:hypothetical protein
MQNKHIINILNSINEIEIKYNKLLHFTKCVSNEDYTGGLRNLARDALKEIGEL